MNKAAPPSSNLQQASDSGESDDRLWLEQARAGDEEAFGEIVKKYQQRVYSVAYRFVNNADDANDMAQQAWIKAWNKLDTFKGESGFFTWMYRVVSFVCLDFLRKRKRLAEHELLDEVEPRRRIGSESAPSTRSRPDREMERAEIQQRFTEALEELSPDHRMALVMREVDGCSYEEIATAMKCRKGTVMSRIFYARQNLQIAMKDLR